MAFDLTHILLALVAGLCLAAALVAWRAKSGAATGSEEQTLRLLALESEIVTLRDAKSEAERGLAAKTEAVNRLETTLADHITRLEQGEHERRGLLAELTSARAESSDRQARLADVQAQLAAHQQTITTQAADLESLRAAHEALRAEGEATRLKLTACEETLAQERKQAHEKLALLANAREDMSKEFKVLAEDVMARHGESFAKQNKEQVDAILSPLREKLTEFEQGLRAAHTETATDRARLAEQIRLLSEHSVRMSSETENLTKALKGQSQTQGAWGEMVLASILERSGLREGEEYVTQESHTAEDGSRLRPDVVVNLPGGQRVVVDAKVSLTAFEDYVNAEDEVVRTSALARHCQSLRTHVKTLGSKDYHTVVGSSLDYVVMFVPIEGALAAALQQDPALTTFAAENNVAIATPTTLMVALRTVSNVWGVERRNRNAEQIAAQAGKLYDKFAGFVSNMQKIETGLNAAQKAYGDAFGQLQSGRGNIMGQIEKLKSLGAKTAKSLPSDLLGADDDTNSLESDNDRENT